MRKSRGSNWLLFNLAKRQSRLPKLTPDQQLANLNSQLDEANSSIDNSSYSNSEKTQLKEFLTGVSDVTHSVVIRHKGKGTSTQLIITNKRPPQPLRLF